MSENESTELVVTQEVNPLDLPVPQLARQLEKRAIKPEVIPEPIRLECGWYLKNWGFSNAELGRLLALSEKKIQRYIKKKRKENCLRYNPDFQSELMGDIIYAWRARRQRLLRMSYMENISLAEQLRILYILHQTDKDMVDMLEKTGYISKEDVEEDMSANYSRTAILNRIIADEEREKARAAKAGEGNGGVS